METWKQGSPKFLDMVEEFGAKGLDYHIIKVMAGDFISNQEKMMFEGNRLISFQTWPPNANAYAFQLARSGFYYSGDSDEVICFACEGRIRDWQQDDDPMKKHAQRFPNCPFVCGQIAGVNLTPPNLDDDHPTIRLMKRVDQVVNKTNETNRMLAARHLSSALTNVTASHTPGQVMVRPVRTQNQGVARSMIALRDENERRKTFEGFWSDTWPVSSKALVQAGFFYCGPEDMVQCAWCYGKLQGWEQGDNPLTEHARHFASCPKFGERKAVKASSLVNVRNAGTNEFSEDDLGILTERPCNPQYAIEAERLRSYNKRWPSNLVQTPEELSSAGFFYIGYADNVKCFFCDGGLCNWESDDEPWTQHARWFPDCAFVKQVKGTTFIQKVKELGVNGGHIISTAETANNKSPSRSLTTEQQREVSSFMRSLSVKKALDTGIPEKAIKIAVTEQLLAGNGHFRDDESLIEAALLANDHLEKSPSPPMVKRRLTGSPPPSTGSATTCNDTTCNDVVKRNEGPGEKKHKKQESPPLSKDKMEEEKPEVLPVNKVALTNAEIREIINDNIDEICRAMTDINPDGANTNSLEEENLKLKEQRLCKICMDEEVSIAFLPCGHLVSCAKCSPACRKCPICRETIKGTVRTFMA